MAESLQKRELTCAIEAPRGTVRNTNLAPSRNSVSRSRSSEEAMTRVMIDLNKTKGKSTRKYTKCPRHSSISSFHITRKPTPTALSTPGAVTIQQTQSKRKPTRNTTSGKVKHRKSGIEPDKRPKPNQHKHARRFNPQMADQTHIYKQQYNSHSTPPGPLPANI